MKWQEMVTDRILLMAIRGRKNCLQNLRKEEVLKRFKKLRKKLSQSTSNILEKFRISWKRFKRQVEQGKRS